MSQANKEPAKRGRPTSQENGPHDTDIFVGRRIRLRRTLLGFSQSVLGSKINLTFQQVQKYERGANRVSASVLLDIANVLDVPIAFFFDGIQTGNNSSDGTPSTKEMYLLRHFRAINDTRLQDAVYAMIRSLVDPELEDAADD